MKEMKSIGTIISYSKSVYMVIGYEACDIGNSIIPHYIVVPIPLGYMNPESLRVIPVDEVEEIVQDGFSNDFGKKYIKGRTFQFEGLKMLSADKWLEEEELFQDSIERMEEHTDG